MYFWYLSSPFPPDKITFSVPFLSTWTIQIHNSFHQQKNPTPHGTPVTCANHRVSALGSWKGIQVGALPAPSVWGSSSVPLWADSSWKQKTKQNHHITDVVPATWAGILCLGGKPSALRAPILAGCLVHHIQFQELCILAAADLISRGCCLPGSINSPQIPSAQLVWLRCALHLMPEAAQWSFRRCFSSP